MAYNPPIGSIYHLYTTYILPSGGLYNPYHLLGEPETATDMFVGNPFITPFITGEITPLFRCARPIIVATTPVITIVGAHIVILFKGIKTITFSSVMPCCKLQIEKKIMTGQPIYPLLEGTPPQK